MNSFSKSRKGLTGRERTLSLKKVCPPGMDEQTEASGDETEVNKPRMRTLNAAAPLHTTSPCSLPPCQEEFHDAMEENDMRQGCGPRLQGSTTESNSEPPEIEVEGAAEAKTEMPASGGSEDTFKGELLLTIPALTERTELIVACKGGGPRASGKGSAVDKLTFGNVMDSIEAAEVVFSKHGDKELELTCPSSLRQVVLSRP